MKLKAIIAVLVFLVGSIYNSFAQEITTKDGFEVRNDYLIIASKKDYKEAKKIALDCSAKLKISFHERGATFDSVKGYLNYPKDTIKNIANSSGEIIRGLHGVGCYKADNGIYITIEQSSNYYQMTKDLYVVVIGSGNVGDQSLRNFLVKAKKLYPDSYIRKTVLFIDGCGY